jgi:GNAT superfamily N-acetyltransferase
MDVRRIGPEDEAGLAESADVLRASDEELWPDLAGFTLRDIRAFAQFRGRTRRYQLLAAEEPGGSIIGVGLVERSLRDNLHAMEVTIAVHPSHRRRGAGTALVDAMAELARADGRQVLNSIVDLPVAVAAGHQSRVFATKVGFVPTLAGNTRHLTVPVDPARLDSLREVVAGARDAADYRTLTFDAPWPAEFVDDECELLRRMSTDEPAGDSAREEEMWDAERLREHEDLRVARGTSKLVAVAQHLPSGRLVAMSELLLAHDTPDQAWQLVTVVHPAHRGHRLGLAVKIANLDALARRAPAARLIVTGNAAVNAPMIAVNDMLGFEVAGEGMFWQKHLQASRER